ALALSAGGETPTPIPTFTPVAGLRVVTPDPNLPQPGIATPATQTAQQLVSTLRVALGDFSSCPSPCSIPTEFADVIEGLEARCEKIDPSSFKASPAYDARI